MANPDEQVRIITSWFAKWNDEQRIQFSNNIGPLFKSQNRSITGFDFDRLSSTLQTLSLSATKGQDQSGRSVFQCQLALCRTWINSWNDLHLQRLMNNIEYKFISFV